MLLLSFLLAWTAYGGNDESKCLMDWLSGEPESSYDGCEIEAEIDDLVGQSQQCWQALGKCQGGGGGGGTIAPMGLIVQYGDKKMPFGMSAKYPLGAAFDEIHKRALEQLELDEDHDLVFDYSNANPKLSGKVTDDDTLEQALMTAMRMGFKLTLNAHKTTLSPTPNPTEPWGKQRTIKQVFGNVADGRDSGIPNGRTMEFTKISKETNLRLHYEDNFRTYNNGAVCYWELYIDGKRVKNHMIRGGMHSQGNENNDHQTASVIGIAIGYDAGKHTYNVQLSGNGRDCYTGWDPESKGTWLMEVKEVMNGRYGYHGFSKYGPAKGEDNMFPLTDRTLKFTKLDAGTIMRFVYMDNMRVYNGGSCRWYLRVDGKICETNKWIATSIHTHGSENDHVPQAFGGYCDKVAEGEHTLAAGVNGNNDCYTGWESSFHLEAQELELGAETGIYMFQRHGNNIDARDNGYVNWRVLNFAKAADDSVLRLFYSDNLRVHGHGKWCKWELRVDQKACTQNISGSRYVVRNQNDHTPGLIIGYCTGFAKGNHQLKVHVKGNSADCYTGWDRQSQNNFVLEVQELAKSDIHGTYS